MTSYEPQQTSATTLKLKVIATYVVPSMLDSQGYSSASVCRFAHNVLFARFCFTSSCFRIEALYLKRDCPGNFDSPPDYETRDHRHLVYRCPWVEHRALLMIWTPLRSHTRIVNMIRATLLVVQRIILCTDGVITVGVESARGH